MKLITQSQTSKLQPLNLENTYAFSSHILPDMWLHIHAGIKANAY